MLIFVLGASISQFLTTATNFHVVFPTKNVSIFFYPSLLHSVANFLCLSVFVFLYISNLWTWQLTSAKNLTTRNNFSFVSASREAGAYAISRQNNLELHLGCHICWLSYLTLLCLWSGRTVGRSVVRSRDYQKCIRMGRLPHFLRYGATLVSDRLTVLKLFSLVP